MAKKRNARESNPGNGAGQNKAGGGETVAGYFRRIFAEHPRLLGEKSNEKLLQRWLADHADQTEVPKSVKANLANLKSVLRSKKRGKVATRAGQDQIIEHGMRSHIATVPTGSSELEALEHQIDECLIRASILDREGLANVIHHLRHARNEVVWKFGQ